MSPIYFPYSATLEATAGRPRASRIRVWDLPTRLFHWALVTCVAVALVTGFLAPEWWMGIHAAAGYAIVGLIVFRVVWAFYGGAYSRIASFVYPPRRIIEHLRGLVLLRPPHYLGHNPTGAVMILVLFATLVGLTASGLTSLGGEEKQGLLAGWVGYGLGDGAKAVHSALAYAVLAMIAVHVGGVAVESVLSRTNLVASMITGWKRLTPDAGDAGLTLRPARPLAALAVLLALAAVSAPVITLAARTPAHGIPHLARNATYTEACGDCHYAYPPSLLPAASWDGLMNSLSNHFGEDASLDPSTAVTVRAWLMANAAERWDTESANRFRAVSPFEPWQITATPYWTHKHAGIAPATFKRKGIGDKGNCIACHRDADSGRFDDQAISIPKAPSGGQS